MTTAELVHLAIHSLHLKNDLSLFWDGVHAAQAKRTLLKDDNAVKRILKMNDTVIYRTADQLRTKDAGAQDHYPVYETNLPGFITGGGTWGNPPNHITAARVQQMVNELGGDMPIEGTPELSPESMVRSEKLVDDVAKRYDWRRQGSVFIHDQLGLVYFSKKIVLHVMAKGMPQP